MQRHSWTRRLSAVLAWVLLGFVIITPVAIASSSPLLTGRDAIYVMAGIAGVIALALLVVQPLLAAGYLPGSPAVRGLRWHRWIGAGIVLAVALHVVGLYLTSPPDALDALLFRSPTPFSVYGVTAMWGVVLTAILVAARRRLGLGNASWRIAHNGLAVVVVVTSVVHALMIEGTMGSWSKLMLCACALAATVVVVLHLRVVKPLLRKR